MKDFVNPWESQNPWQQGGAYHNLALDVPTDRFVIPNYDKSPYARYIAQKDRVAMGTAIYDEEGNWLYYNPKGPNAAFVKLGTQQLDYNTIERALGSHALEESLEYILRLFRGAYIGTNSELILRASICYGEAYYRDVNWQEMAGIDRTLMRNVEASFGARNIYRESAEFRKYESVYKKLQALPNLPNGYKVHYYLPRSGGFTYAYRLRSGNERAQQFMWPDREVGQSTGKALMDRVNLNIEMRYALKAIIWNEYGGYDYSMGAYFWDGKDLKIMNTPNNPRIACGFKYSDDSHNIFKFNSKRGINEYSEIYGYESTNAIGSEQGGTIFWNKAEALLNKGEIYFQPCLDNYREPG